MTEYENERFVSVVPFNKMLRKYIAYYYFHECKANDFKKTYVYYPHIRNTITIYQNQSAFISDDLCIYEPTKVPASTVYYSRNLKKQIRVIQNGPLHKIGIVFNPLGINHFIKEKLWAISKKTYGPFTHYCGELALLCKKIHLWESNFKIKALDDFFETKLISFENKRLSNSLRLIHDSKAKIKVSEIAEELGVTRKTLYREFKNHLCSSVDEYKMIFRFRLALNYYYKTNNPILTDVAYENSFYDQPNFVAHFKKVTGHAPGDFFKNLSRLSDNDIYWTLL